MGVKDKSNNLLELVQKPQFKQKMLINLNYDPIFSIIINKKRKYLINQDT